MFFGVLNEKWLHMLIIHRRSPDSNMAPPYILTTGLQRAPDWDSFLLQYYSAKLSGATTIAADSLIAQLDSKG
jgi:hypothetical protein